MGAAIDCFKCRRCFTGAVARLLKALLSACAEEEQLDWGLYASNVRALMAERLGVPLVEEGIAEERRLAHMGLGVNWRGTRLTFAKRKAA